MSHQLPDDETIREAVPYWVRRRRGGGGKGPTLHIPDPDADRDGPEPLCETKKHRGEWDDCDVDCYPLGYGSVCKRCKRKFDPLNTSMTNVIERSCAICGDDMIITLAEDGEILDGGYYWPDSLLEGDETDDDEEEEETADEYWECPDCYNRVEAELDEMVAEVLAQQSADAVDDEWTALDDAELDGQLEH